MILIEDLGVPKNMGAVTVLVCNNPGFGEDFAINNIYELEKIIKEIENE